MARTTPSLGSLSVALVCGVAIAVSPHAPAPNVSPDCPEASSTTQPANNGRIIQQAELKLDPAVFFQRLVNRYRGLHLYRDVVNVVQVTQREGHESSRVETQIACEVSNGTLKVQTPASQVREGLGLGLPVKQSQGVKDAKQKYDLWMAPHMALKFTQEPLKHMRAGVDEGFTATEAESVTIDNKKMVHVELRSGDGLSEDSSAKFDLYVNSDSMLIERIEGEQRLPDGASYSTTLEITPGEVQAEAPSAETAAPEPMLRRPVGPMT